MPLPEETAVYKYFKQGYDNSGEPAEKDSSGMYPGKTRAKRFCKRWNEEDKTDKYRLPSFSPFSLL